MASHNRGKVGRRRARRDRRGPHLTSNESAVKAAKDGRPQEIDILLKQYDIVWSNIHHNETVRDQLFNFYLVAFSFLMLGSFELLGIHAEKLKDIPRPATSIPFLVIAFVGMVTVAMQARLRAILNRDIKTSNDIRTYLGSKYPEAAKSFSRLQVYFADRGTSRFHQAFSLSHLIMYIAGVTSAFAAGFGIYLGLQNAIAGAAAFIALLALSYVVERVFEADRLFKGSE